MLREQPGNCFLVRDSESSVGAYSLSVGVGPLENKNLLHYIIQKTGEVYILNPAPVSCDFYSAEKAKRYK